jgi:hypothetical protein
MANRKAKKISGWGASLLSRGWSWLEYESPKKIILVTVSNS